MAVSFRADPAFANQAGTSHTIDPSTDPSTDDILIAVAGNSSAAAPQAAANTIGSNTMGGTWTQEHTSNWAARRNLQIWVNDDITTVTGSVIVTKNANQDFATGLIIVTGADSYTESVSVADSGGGWTPTLLGGQDAYIAIIQSEDNETVPVPSGWSSLASVNDADGLRTLTVHYHLGPLSDTTPTWNFAGTPGYSAWTAYFAATQTSTEVNPVPTVVSPVSAIGNVGGAGDVNPVPTIVTPRSAVADISGAEGFTFDYEVVLDQERVVDHSPANNGSGDYTSSAFTTTADSLLVAVIRYDAWTAINGVIPTPVTSGLTWVLKSSAYTPPGNNRAHVEIWMADNVSGGSKTISQTSTDGNWDNNVNSIDLTVIQFLGALAEEDQVGATASANISFGPSDAGPETITLTGTPDTFSFIVATVACDTTGTGGILHGTGWTELSETDPAGAGPPWLASQVQIITGHTSTSVTWDDLAEAGANYQTAMAALEVLGAEEAPVEGVTPIGTIVSPVSAVADIGGTLTWELVVADDFDSYPDGDFTAPGWTHDDATVAGWTWQVFASTGIIYSPHGTLWYEVPTGDEAVKVETSFKTNGGPPGARLVGGVVFAFEDNDNFISWEIVWTEEPKDFMILSRRSGGSWTELEVSGSMGFSPETYYDMRLEMVGESIKGWLDDVLLLDYVADSGEYTGMGSRAGLVSDQGFPNFTDVAIYNLADEPEAVEVNPIGTVVSPVSAIADTAHVSTIEPVGTVVSPRSAVADITGTAGVTPVGTLVTTTAAVANIGGHANVNPVGTIVTPVSPVGQIGEAELVDICLVVGPPMFATRMPSVAFADRQPGAPTLQPRQPGAPTLQAFLAPVEMVFRFAVNLFHARLSGSPVFEQRDATVAFQDRETDVVLDCEEV